VGKSACVIGQNIKRNAKIEKVVRTEGVKKNNLT
jgi:hypothetical protein